MSEGRAPEKGISTRTSFAERQKARELLLALLRYDNGDAADERLVRISRAEWDELARQAMEYRAAGLLYRRLKRASTESAMPAEVRDRLRKWYLATASRNMRMYAVLGKVLSRLKGNGIDVIVLKGGFLAEAIYGDIALRMMDDLDVLVRPSDLERADELLVQAGLSTEEENNREFSGKTQHRAYCLRPASVFVEIHWSIDESPSPFRIDMEGLWERARPATIAGAEVKTLCPEDLILHICVHTAFRHLFDSHGLQSMYDLAETIRHYGQAIDWEQLKSRALRWGMEEPAWLALELAVELAGAAVPLAVLGELAPADLDPRAVEQCEKRILANGDLREPMSENWGRLLASRTLGGKLAALFGTLFPRPEVLAATYGMPAESRRVYLYYPVRLQHLVRRQARVVWQVMRGEPEMRAWVEGEGHRVELEMRKRMRLPREGKGAG